eukprot:537095-Pelagomonas_calceolata.AAC.1
MQLRAIQLVHFEMQMEGNGSFNLAGLSCASTVFSVLIFRNETSLGKSWWKSPPGLVQQAMRKGTKDHKGSGKTPSSIKESETNWLKKYVSPLHHKEKEHKERVGISRVTGSTQLQSLAVKNKKRKVKERSTQAKGRVH